MPRAHATLEDRLGAAGGIRTGSSVADRDDFISHLLEGHLGEIYSFHYRLCRDEIQAENRTRSTFLRAVQEIRTYRLGTSLRTWLFGIAANVATDIGTAAARLHDVPIDGVEQVPSPPEKAPTEVEDWQQAVENGLVDLPPIFGVVLVLKVLEGFSHQEAARALDVSEEAVRWRLWKARTVLRERLCASRKVGVGRHEV